MKFRKGFVTNSSSSSYVCDICGAQESGWDMGLGDAHMYECANGHTICESHTVNIFEDKDLIKNIFEDRLDRAIARETSDWWTEDKKQDHIKNCAKDLEDYVNGEWDEYDLQDELEDVRYSLPEKYCPICTFEKASDKDILAFILKENGFDKKIILETMKDKFKNYSEFVKWNNKK